MFDFGFSIHYREIYLPKHYLEYEKNEFGFSDTHPSLLISFTTKITSSHHHEFSHIDNLNQPPETSW
jgi:hypothetical protein